MKWLPISIAFTLTACIEFFPKAIEYRSHKTPAGYKIESPTLYLLSDEIKKNIDIEIAAMIARAKAKTPVEAKCVEEQARATTLRWCDTTYASASTGIVESVCWFNKDMPVNGYVSGTTAFVAYKGPVKKSALIHEMVHIIAKYCYGIQQDGMFTHLEWLEGVK